MTLHPYILLAGALAVMVCAVSGTNPLAPLVDVVDRGQRLNYSTVVGGVVQESAAVLAAAAGEVLGRPVTLDAIALARMVRSEDGTAGQIAKCYKCHVAFNQAEKLGWSVVKLITYHTAADRAGHFGEQITGRFASGRDPYENDLSAAEYAIAQRAAGQDPTFGALNFVDVGGFGAQLGSGSFQDTVEAWAKDGKVPGRLPDSPSGLIFFWRGEVPDNAEPVA